MVMKARVLIGFVTDAMFRTGRARQKRCGGAAVQIVNNVVVFASQLCSEARAGRCALAFERNHIVDIGKTI